MQTTNVQTMSIQEFQFLMQAEQEKELVVLLRTITEQAEPEDVRSIEVNKAQTQGYWWG